MEGIFVNDVGTKLVFDVGIDTSQITKAEIHVRKPDKTNVTWSAQTELNSTNIYYILQQNDVDMVGVYKLQPYLELSSGWKGHGTPVYMEVKEAV